MINLQQKGIVSEGVAVARGRRQKLIKTILIGKIRRTQEEHVLCPWPGTGSISQGNIQGQGIGVWGCRALGFGVVL